MWARNPSFQRLGGGFLERLGLTLWSKVQMSALHGRKDPEAVRLIRLMRRERKSLLSAFEAFLLYATAKAQSRWDADMAEVGVFEGASAKLMCEAKGERALRLFDTFEGLPPATEKDRGVHVRKKQYHASLASVQSYLSGYQNVQIYKGLFPASAPPEIAGAMYSFVHLDVDLYESTLESLKYFYPRMILGGIILSHDYGMLAGVEAAFQEFFADKPEIIIEQPTTQCMIVKR